MNAEWTLFSDGRETVAIPRSPLLVRLRRVISDEFFGQAPLASLKRLMDAVFIAGPGLILVALYLPRGGGLLVWLGILCLAVASAYWFAPHWLCRQYLSRRGFRQVGMVEAPDLAGALAAAPEAGAGK